jgi:phosphoglycolate phosphatase-like HAD superfamily hydrolase
MIDLYIFDLDGTLSDSTHRTHLIKDRSDPDRWDKFNAAAKDDPPNEAVLKMLGMIINAGHDVMIFTGRSDEVRADTLTWLKSFVGDYVDGWFDYDAALVMRKEKDHREDTVLKMDWYQNLLDEDDRARLVAVFEDRSRMVKMWRDLGITCFQVANGDF